MFKFASRCPQIFSDLAMPHTVATVHSDVSDRFRGSARQFVKGVSGFRQDRLTAPYSGSRVPRYLRRSHQSVVDDQSIGKLCGRAHCRRLLEIELRNARIKCLTCNLTGIQLLMECLSTETEPFGDLLRNLFQETRNLVKVVRLCNRASSSPAIAVSDRRNRILRES